MRVTKTDVSWIFNVQVDAIKQIDSKQLFIVDSPDKGRVLISYKTIVGRFTDNEWLLTTERYSETTSKQLNQFANRTKFPVRYVADIWEGVE